MEGRDAFITLFGQPGHAARQLAAPSCTCTVRIQNSAQTTSAATTARPGRGLHAWDRLRMNTRLRRLRREGFDVCGEFQSAEDLVTEALGCGFDCVQAYRLRKESCFVDEVWSHHQQRGFFILSSTSQSSIYQQGSYHNCSLSQRLYPDGARQMVGRLPAR